MTPEEIRAETEAISAGIEVELLEFIEKCRREGRFVFCDNCARGAIQEEDPDRVPGMRTIEIGEHDDLLLETLKRLASEGLLKQGPCGCSREGCQSIYRILDPCQPS